jgi:hypothetical protein
MSLRNNRPKCSPSYFLAKSCYLKKLIYGKSSPKFFATYVRNFQTNAQGKQSPTKALAA